MNRQDAEFDDEAYAEWLAATGCRCCHVCWENPCGACQQGGVCDRFRCTCDDEPDDEEESE
jgi:hypothetical protein